MLTDALLDTKLLKANIVISELKDWSMEDAYAYAKEWGNFFYYNAVNQLGTKGFSFYYNDDPPIAENWFTNMIKSRITLRNAAS